MKIHLISDIHTEKGDVPYGTPPNTDLVVLAGDVGEGIDGLIWARKTFSEVPIIYVAGNHEFYGHGLSLLDLMRKTAKQLDMVFLENDEVIINHVRFLGCTLWTDFNNHSIDAIKFASKNMNDYHWIKDNKWWSTTQLNENILEEIAPHSRIKDFYNYSFSPSIANAIHKKSIEWLDNKLNEKFNGKTIVITHHAPSFQNTWGAYRNTNLCYCYCSDLDDFIMSKNIDFWFHGHLHQPIDYKIGKTRIVSNPKGYPITGQKTVACNNFNFFRSHNST